MGKSRYQVKGTKDFLVATVVCVFLCLWSIRDGWFPTQKVLQKHPLSFTVTNSVPGQIKTVSVQSGDIVDGTMELVVLDDTFYQRGVEVASAAYTAAKGGAAADVQSTTDALLKAKENLRACIIRNTDFTLKTSHGDEPLRGKVLQVVAERSATVEAGSSLLVVQPRDTFYAFNKTLSIVSFIAALGFFYFHRVASR